MEKLTKPYKVIAKDGKLLFKVTEEGMNTPIYPGRGTEYAEFDSYEEAKAYVSLQGYVFEEPQQEAAFLE